MYYGEKKVEAVNDVGNSIFVKNFLKTTCLKAELALDVVGDVTKH